MTISVDTHIVLGIHSPKKDAVIGEGDPALSLTDDTCAIWANGVPNAALVQTLVGSWHDIHNWVQSEQLKAASSAVWVSMPPGAGDSAIAVTAPGAGEIGLYIPLNGVDTNRSHFLDRTFKRLIERWLELSKTGVGNAPA